MSDSGEVNQQKLARVWQVLAEIYPEARQAQRVAAEAGVPTLRVDLTGSALDRWYVLVTEAEKLGLLAALLAVALREYPAHRALRDATERFITPLPSPGPRISTSRLPVPGPHFVGRQAELARLDAAWADPRTHVVSIVAWGGTGKSALVRRWLTIMAPDYRGAARVFGWSFHTQGTQDDHGAAGDAFVAEALRWFGDPAPDAGSPPQRGERLANLVRQQRTLLVLDGLEPLQAPPGPDGGRVRDPAVNTLLRELAAGMDGVCVVTTRHPVEEVAAVEMELDQLGEEDGVALLRLCGVGGEGDELRAAVREMKGHALALVLLGNYVVEVLEGDIQRRAETQLVDPDAPVGAHAERVMLAYDGWFGPSPARAVLRVLGLFNRPATIGCLESLVVPPSIAGVTEGFFAGPRDRWHHARWRHPRWRRAVAAVRRAGLVASAPTPDDGSLDAHPLVRAFFGTLLERETPEGYRAAQGRLYEYLRDSTTPHQPNTVGTLQPLYQAVWHGCRAGRHEEAFDDVFVPRILHGAQRFSTRVLGLVGTNLEILAEYFDGAWASPLPSLTPRTRARVASEAGFLLRALGRLEESREAGGSAIMAWERAGDTREGISESARAAAQLAETELALRHTAAALAYGGRSVAWANRSGDAYHWLSKSAVVGRVHHFRGEFAHARAAFEDGERRYAGDPQPPPVISQLARAFHCDLLLDLRDGSARVWVERMLMDADRGGQLLDRALARLALGRAVQSQRDLGSAAGMVDEAIGLLRAASELDKLLGGLLARAELCLDAARLEHAGRDLAEVLRVATRCGFRLVECDARLLAARLAIGAGDLPAARTAHARAAHLVTECGYHRRDVDVVVVAAQLALAAGDRAGALKTCERARGRAAEQGYRACDAELEALAVRLGM